MLHAAALEAYRTAESALREAVTATGMPQDSIDKLTPKQQMVQDRIVGLVQGEGAADTDEGTDDDAATDTDEGTDDDTVELPAPAQVKAGPPAPAPAPAPAPDSFVAVTSVDPFAEIEAMALGGAGAVSSVTTGGGTAALDEDDPFAQLEALASAGAASASGPGEDPFAELQSLVS
jgi:hypothetical protein